MYLNCYRHLGSQLAEMEKVIDKMMQEDFVRYATTDLNRPLTESDAVPEEVARIYAFYHSRLLPGSDLMTFRALD